MCRRVLQAGRGYLYGLGHVGPSFPSAPLTAPWVKLAGVPYLESLGLPAPHLALGTLDGPFVGSARV